MPGFSKGLTMSRILIPVVWGAAIVVGGLVGPQVWGQAPGVAIEVNGPASRNPDLVKQAAELKESGKLLSLEQIREQVANTSPAELTLPPARSRVMPARTLAAMAKQAYVRVGWYSQQKDSERWQLNLAGGYAITADGVVVTCFHCVDPSRNLAEGGLIAIDSSGKVRPVTKIVAAHKELDACLVQVEGGGFQPLPLSDRLSPGDTVYCFSEPYSQSGYFSNGIVNRFYWNRKPADDAEGMDQVKHLRLNVSTDWAPGSSGAAVLDYYGNAVGHVSRIRPLTLNRTAPGDEPPEDQPSRERTRPSQGPTVMILHEAIPARGVMALARGGRVEPTPALIAQPTTPVIPSTPVEPPKPTLEIGMPAPKLQTAKWVQGEPVTEFAAGTAYVVEFWATWCGPCIVTIPHLNELHQKFVNQGLVVIGQDIWQREETTEKTQEAVEQFIAKMGEKMTYRVALDDKSQDEKGAMARTWMDAAGQNGIPSAFVVGKDGKIAWIGHPSRLNEQILSSVLDGTFDVAAAKKEFEIQRQVTQVLRTKLRPFQLALVQQKWDDAEKALAEIEEALPEGNRQIVDRYRFDMALRKKDASAASKMAEKIISAPDVPPLTYNDLAWRMITAPGLENPDLDLCERLARKGIELTDGTGKANVIDTLARVKFLQGNKTEAIELQQQAVEQAAEQQKEKLQETLDAYKKGELPKAD
jgi:thiol-disulfide isomerase/thioredoxin